MYNFPTTGNGSGQTVAIIELGGGYRKADLDTYFKGLKLNSPSVTAVSVDNGKNTPGSDADGEVMLDIEVVGAVANGAKIAVYFAPNTDQGFVDAIIDAAHDYDAKAFRDLDQLGRTGRFVERTIPQRHELRIAGCRDSRRHRDSRFGRQRIDRWRRRQETPC